MKIMKHAEDEIQSINVKLFLWAVFFDHYNLSLHFWRRLNVNLYLDIYYLFYICFY